MQKSVGPYRCVCLVRIINIMKRKCKINIYFGLFNFTLLWLPHDYPTLGGVKKIYLTYKLLLQIIVLVDILSI